MFIVKAVKYCESCKKDDRPRTHRLAELQILLLCGRIRVSENPYSRIFNALLISKNYQQRMGFPAILTAKYLTLVMLRNTIDDF